MKVTLVSIRARNMKQGKSLPIRTCCQWRELKQEREKPLDLNKLLDAYARFLGQGGKINTDSTWPREGKDRHYD